MTVSVIICVRNELPEVFSRTLRFFDQERSKHDFELIIVDDASNVPISGLPDWVSLIRNSSREGIARSRNLGAAVSKGDVLLFTDAHVRFSGDWYAWAHAAFGDATIAGSAVRIFHDLAEWDQKGTPTYYGWRLSPEPEDGVHPIRERMSDMPFEVPYVGGAYLAVSHRWFDWMGGFDGGLKGAGSLGDMELAMRCYAMGGRVFTNPNVVCHHYTAPQGKIDMAGRCPMDLPRYEGSLRNFLAAMDNHGMCDQKLKRRLKTKYPNTDISCFPVENGSFYNTDWRNKSSRTLNDAQVFLKITGLI